ncbi:hypothetical protein [Nocardia sp. NPDC050793]|uniref:hypothetical protein n=1 Tax=Nocardia sp. NPDC050793 TaxID=3155159 RepID=UPI00340A4076
MWYKGFRIIQGLTRAEWNHRISDIGTDLFQVPESSGQQLRSWPSHPTCGARQHIDVEANAWRTSPKWKK